MEALKVSDFRLIAGIGERFEAGFDKFTDAPAKDGLFAEEVGFGFFGEGGFQNSGPGATNAARIRKSEFLCFACGVLLYGKKARSTAAFGKDFADAMARSFGSDHGNVNIRGRLDGAEANIKAVGEHQRFARFEVWRDGLDVKFFLFRIRRENHDDVSPCRGFGGRVDDKTVFFRLCSGGAAFWQADADIAAAIAQVQRVGMALGAVTNDCDFLRLDKREVRIL